MAGDEHPLIWHYFSDLDDAIEAMQAADLLELPFVLHKEERTVEPDEAGGDDLDGESVIVTYVLVILPPGAEFEVASGDDDVEDDDEYVEDEADQDEDEDDVDDDDQVDDSDDNDDGEVDDEEDDGS